MQKVILIMDLQVVTAVKMLKVILILDPLLIRHLQV
jgi:hypothetical protein